MEGFFNFFWIPKKENNINLFIYIYIIKIAMFYPCTRDDIAEFTPWSAIVAVEYLVICSNACETVIFAWPFVQHIGIICTSPSLI